MSELPKDQRADLYEIAHSIANEHETEPVDSSARFSLAKDTSTDVFIQDTETSARQRLLIARESPAAQVAYQLLHEVGLEQFKRTVVPSENDICVYELPIHAKPLSHEQLDVEQDSSETHVSDSELFRQLGTVWRVVYEQTNRLPVSPLAATALLNTEETEQAIIPIPPYDDWALQTDSKDATARNFLESIHGELRTTHPETPLESLMEATREGWGS